jgi:hypothetical protein
MDVSNAASDTNGRKRCRSRTWSLPLLPHLRVQEPTAKLAGRQIYLWLEGEKPSFKMTFGEENVSLNQKIGFHSRETAGEVIL